MNKKLSYIKFIRIFFKRFNKFRDNALFEYLVQSF